MKNFRYLALGLSLGTAVGLAACTSPALAGSGLSGLAPLNGLNYGLMGQPVPQQPYYAPPIYETPPQPINPNPLGIIPRQQTRCYWFGSVWTCNTQ